MVRYLERKKSLDLAHGVKKNDIDILAYYSLGLLLSVKRLSGFSNV